MGDPNRSMHSCEHSSQGQKSTNTTLLRQVLVKLRTCLQRSILNMLTVKCTFLTEQILIYPSAETECLAKYFSLEFL